MRPADIPPALNGQPFRTVDAYALGVSLKTLQGSRFRRIAKGVYVAAATADTHHLSVRLESPDYSYSASTSDLKCRWFSQAPILGRCAAVRLR